MRYLIALVFTLAASSAFAATCDTAERFTTGTDTDGTAIVTDSKTGLIWKRCLQGQTFVTGTPPACNNAATMYTWPQALGLTVAGSWRVPNIKELESIVDEAKATISVDGDGNPLGQNPAIDTACFPTPFDTSVFVWSASPYAGNTANSWLIDFKDGQFYNIWPQTSTAQVRLVKDP